MGIAVVVDGCGKRQRNSNARTARKHAKHDDFSHQLQLLADVYLSVVCVCVFVWKSCHKHLCASRVACIFCGLTCIDRVPEWMDNGLFWQRSIRALAHAEPTPPVPSLCSWPNAFSTGWKIITIRSGNFLSVAKHAIEPEIFFSKYFTIILLQLNIQM